MSMPLEHDYIGLTEVPSMDTPEKVSSTITTTTTTTTTTTSDTNSNNSDRNSATGLNFKATELRLGLPGSQSPERTTTDHHHHHHHHKETVEDNNVYPLGVLKSLVSGAKRGFSDTIDIASGKWGFSGTGGSEGDLVKNGGLFSPRGKNGGKPVTGPEVNGQQLGLVKPAVANDAVAKFPRPVQEKKAQVPASNGHGSGPASKAQVVGWPPVRSFRKNTMANNPPKNDDNLEGKLGSGCLYVKVSMDDAPYLRKLDLQTCGSYVELSTALEKMFSCFTIGSGQSGSDGVPNQDVMNKSRLMDLLHGSEYVLTFEDKDGDWMLVGDVPWKMFTVTCKRLRIMKSSEAIGLAAPTAMEKGKTRS